MQALSGHISRIGAERGQLAGMLNHATTALRARDEMLLLRRTRQHEARPGHLVSLEADLSALAARLAGK